MGRGGGSGAVGRMKSVQDNTPKRGLGRPWQPRMVALAVACWVIGLAAFVWMLVLAAR